MQYEHTVVSVSHTYSHEDLVTIARYDEPFLAHFYKTMV